VLGRAAERSALITATTQRDRRRARIRPKIDGEMFHRSGGNRRSLPQFGRRYKNPVDFEWLGGSVRLPARNVRHHATHAAAEYVPSAAPRGICQLLMCFGEFPVGRLQLCDKTCFPLAEQRHVSAFCWIFCAFRVPRSRRGIQPMPYSHLRRRCECPQRPLGISME
jgi:hypothetical protein